MFNKILSFYIERESKQQPLKYLLLFLLTTTFIFTTPSFSKEIKLSTPSSKNIKLTFYINDKIYIKYLDIINMILNTESMDDKERQYWFDVMPSLNKEQISKLLLILDTERKKLEALEKRYSHKLKNLNKKHLNELEIFKVKESIKKYCKKENFYLLVKENNINHKLIIKSCNNIDIKNTEIEIFFTKMNINKNNNLENETILQYTKQILDSNNLDKYLKIFSFKSLINIIKNTLELSNRLDREYTIKETKATISSILSDIKNGKYKKEFKSRKIFEQLLKDSEFYLNSVSENRDNIIKLFNDNIEYISMNPHQIHLLIYKFENRYLKDEELVNKITNYYIINDIFAKNMNTKEFSTELILWDIVINKYRTTILKNNNKFIEEFNKFKNNILSNKQNFHGNYINLNNDYFDNNINIMYNKYKEQFKRFTTYNTNINKSILNTTDTKLVKLQYSDNDLASFYEYSTYLAFRYWKLNINNQELDNLINDKYIQNIEDIIGRIDGLENNTESIINQYLEPKIKVYLMQYSTEKNKILDIVKYIWDKVIPFLQGWKEVIGSILLLGIFINFIYRRLLKINDNHSKLCIIYLLMINFTKTIPVIKDIVKLILKKSFKSTQYGRYKNYLKDKKSLKLINLTFSKENIFYEKDTVNILFTLKRFLFIPIIIKEPSSDIIKDIRTFTDAGCVFEIFNEIELNDFVYILINPSKDYITQFKLETNNKILIIYKNNKGGKI